MSSSSGLRMSKGRKSALLWLSVFIGCAAVSPPPGGPVDETPPVLISVDPPPGATGISGGLNVTLVFSERLVESVPEQGVRISPALETPVTIRSKRNKILVSLPKRLADDQTYLMTVTRDIRDEHGNRLDRTYQFAFSTGVEVSTGRIAGTVYGREEGSSTVYLYKSVGGGSDTLFTGRPQYFVETDDSGRYAFAYLDPGDYRLIAVRGGTPPSPVVPSRMPYGVPWKDHITLSPGDTVENVNMRLFNEMPPFRVVSTEMKSSKLGMIRFTNPMSLSAQENYTIELAGGEKGTKMAPGLVFQHRDGDREVSFYAEDLKGGEGYLLSVSGIRDTTGVAVLPFSRDLRVPEADTLAPAIVDPQAGKTVLISPGKDPVRLQFLGPVLAENLPEAVTVRDTSGAPIKSTLSWVNPTRLGVVPEDGWRPGTRYEIHVLGGSIHTSQSVSMKDSTVKFEIRAGEEPGYGGLYGSVVGKYAENSIVTAQAPEKPSISYSVNVNSSGDFAFSTLPALYWVLTAYQDRDGNGRYTYGRAVPFEPSEPFLVFPDTVEVRANWDVEGVLLEYPGHRDLLP